MSSCFGRSKRRRDDTAPLLPKYRDDTALQEELHKKLHTYQMIRALGKGYMPSNEQIIIHIRTISAADVLNPDDNHLSDSGRLLVKYAKQWLTQFMGLLLHKNCNDEVQDFIWYLAKSRIKVDVEDIANKAHQAKTRADTVTAYESIRTVGSLLLTNSDFRLLLTDVNVLVRQIFSDAALSLSDVAEKTGKALEPSKAEQEALKEPGKDTEIANGKPIVEEVQEQVVQVGEMVAGGAAQVAQDAVQSAAAKLQAGEGETLMNRLKEAVIKLRKRPDYTDSVSTLALLIQRYAETYSRAVEDTVTAAEQDVQQNAEANRAIKNFWSFVTSFGDKEAWQELEADFKRVISHKDSDAEFEELMAQVVNSLQALLTDPAFYEKNTASSMLGELKKQTDKLSSSSSGSTLRSDVDALLAQCHKTVTAVLHDRDIAALMVTSTRLATILSPAHHYINTALLTDAIDVFVPLFLSSIQHIPIPRLELSTPELDLLLEHVVIQPGRTVNATSFLPYKVRISTHNDIELRRTHTHRTASASTTVITIALDGLSVRADDVGFWLRTHSGMLRYADEGIASIALDERGVDIHLDVEIGRERVANVLTLRAVRVHVHKLQYRLRQSKLSWIAWLFKPLLRPILKRVFERQLEGAIADFFHAANREVVFARERLRATRVADPRDLVTFVKAVAARMRPREDADVYSRVGVGEPGKGVFRGVYAPGSLVKLWEEEGKKAAERIEDGAEEEGRGWRNEVFDLHTV